MDFDTKIKVPDQMDDEEAAVRERLPEILERLKKVNPGRYDKVDPAKLAPDHPLYAEVRRQTMRAVKPDILSKRIENTLEGLRKSDTYDTYLQRRLAAVKTQTAEGPTADLSARSKELFKKLASALASGREQYKDVFNPFEREKLAAQSAGQVEEELRGVDELRRPEAALYEAIPQLAQRDVTESRQRASEELDALQALYGKAQQDATGFENEYEKIIAKERDAKPRGGGGYYRAPTLTPKPVENNFEVEENLFGLTPSSGGSGGADIFSGGEDIEIDDDDVFDLTKAPQEQEPLRPVVYEPPPRRSSAHIDSTMFG